MLFYFVQRGETLVSIARRYQTTVHAIVAANRLEDPNAISPGQALIIPRPGEVPTPPPGGIVHRVRPGETLFHLAERYGRSAREIMQANHLAHPEFLLAGQRLVIPEPAGPGDDWPMLGRTPGRAAETAASVEGAPVRAWQATPARAGGTRPSPPVLRYGRVYAGMSDGRYWCLDQETGAIRWRAEAGEGAGGDLPAPAVYDGLAYLCGPDGTLLAADARTGRRIWRLALDGPAAGAPAVDGGMLFVGTRTGRVWAVEAKTGAIAWRTALEGEMAQPVALGDDRLFAVTGLGQLWALEAATGRVTWRAAAEAHPPVYAELLVIAGGSAFDPLTGEVVWRVEGAPCSPAVRRDQVIYPGRALDLFTGQAAQPVEPASRAAEPAARAAGLVVAGDAALFFAEGPRLEARRLGTGEPLWRLDLPAPGVGTPAVAPGRLFFTLADGTLFAYRIEPR